MQNEIQFSASTTQVFAICVTAIALAISAVSALDHATGLYQVLMVALYVAICAATHFILATSNRPIAWVLWFFCLLGTVFIHLTFITNANLRAGEDRAKHSVQKTAIERQIEVANEALLSIKARPITVVEELLATSQDWKQRSALRAERAEAKRAAALYDELIRLSATATTAIVVASRDPVVSSIETLTGVTAVNITLVVSLYMSILLELVGALLWRTTLRLTSESSLAHVARESQAAHDPMADLRRAVDSGECPSTVSGIRKFMRCGQEKALAMRRVLQSETEATAT